MLETLQKLAERLQVTLGNIDFRAKNVHIRFIPPPACRFEALFGADDQLKAVPEGFLGLLEEAMKSSLVVANRFLELAKQNSDSLSPMQLLKLVYIAHGWMLGLYGRPLIKDEVQAWQYGPVIPKLYNKIKAFGSQHITGTLTVGADVDNSLDKDEADIIKQVYDLYGRKTGPALSRITHAEGTPWTKTYRQGTFGLVISNDLIEDHYQRLAAS